MSTAGAQRSVIHRYFGDQSRLSNLVGGRRDPRSMYTPGQLIHRQRELRAWTQRELADRCGLSKSQLSVFEAGAREPTWSVLCRILAAMGLQPRVTAEECDVSQHQATAEVRDLRRCGHTTADWRAPA